MSRNAFAQIVRDELAAEDQKDIHRDELAQMQREAILDALRLDREICKQTNIKAEASALMAEWVSLTSAYEYTRNYDLLMDHRAGFISTVAICMAMVKRGDLTGQSAAEYVGKNLIDAVRESAMKVAKHHVEGAE